jgi:hypothetical protein
MTTLAQKKVASPYDSVGAKLGLVPTVFGTSIGFPHHAFGYLITLWTLFTGLFAVLRLTQDETGTNTYGMVIISAIGPLLGLISAAVLAYFKRRFHVDVLEAMHGKQVTLDVYTTIQGAAAGVGNSMAVAAVAFIVGILAFGVNMGVYNRFVNDVDKVVYPVPSEVTSQSLFVVVADVATLASSFIVLAAALVSGFVGGVAYDYDLRAALRGSDDGEKSDAKEFMLSKPLRTASITQQQAQALVAAKLDSRVPLLGVATSTK